MPVSSVQRWQGGEHLAQRPLIHAAAAAAAIRVFVVDDRPLCRRGLAVMLADKNLFDWAGEAGGGAEAMALVAEAAPDVVLVEHRMPAFDGVVAVEALRKLCPQARFIVLTGTLESHEVRRAMNAGASCVLLQSVDTPELVQAVRSVHAGQRVITPIVAAALANGGTVAPTRNDLTRRELALLQLMAEGLENRAIAVELSISVPTVKFHITNIMGKLQAANRTAAVLVGLRYGLVNLHRSDTAAVGG